MAQNDPSSNERNEAAQNEMLTAVLQRLGIAGGGGAAPQSDDTHEAQAPSSSGDILSSLLSNPELLAKLPTIISSVKPILDIIGRSAGAGESTAVASLPVKSQSLPSAAKHDQGSDPRSALLCAMKPYLSQDRRNAVDYIIKLSRLGDILKTL